MEGELCENVVGGIRIRVSLIVLDNNTWLLLLLE